jgi:P27 family predicted phage terminase small subunit
MNRKNLIDYLSVSGNFKEIDETQIDLYIQTIWVAEQAFLDIKARGIQINIRPNNDTPYYQTNGSAGVFFSAIKSIQTIANSLGLSPKARKELGFEDNLPKADDLDRYARM